MRQQELGITGNNLRAKDSNYGGLGSGVASESRTPNQVGEKSGTIQGSHYDPHSAFNNPEGRQRRPAPVGQASYGSATGGQKPSSKIGGQPTQKKNKGAAGAPAGSRSSSHQVSAVNSNNIVKMSEIEELRNYNAMMNNKMQQRDAQMATEIIAASKPPAQQVEDVPSTRPDMPAFHSSVPANKLEHALLQAAPLEAHATQEHLGGLLVQKNEYSDLGNQKQQTKTQYSPAPIQSVVNPGATIYPRTNDRDKHHLSIVGSHKLAMQTSLHQDASQMANDKEVRQREFAFDLQRQIEERDIVRQQQKDQQQLPSMRRSPIKHQQQPPELMVTGQASHAAKTSFYPPDDRTFYVNGAAPSGYPAVAAQTRATHFDASITKQDFPEMKLRGRVLENRLDLELERHGNILTLGRDEQDVIQNKREAEQVAMREALQLQINEKNRKRDQERARDKQDEIRDEIRVREQMHAMAVAEGKINIDEGPGIEVLAPVRQLSDALAAEANAVAATTNYNDSLGGGTAMHFAAHKTLGGSRKTAYAANQHSVSIIGTDIGTAHLPQNFAQAPPAFGQSGGEENLANMLTNPASPKATKIAPELTDVPVTGVDPLRSPQMASAKRDPGSPEFEREEAPAAPLSPQQHRSSPQRLPQPPVLQVAGASIRKQQSQPQNDGQVAELSSMVQQLLAQQQALQDQLSKQKLPPKQSGSSIPLVSGQSLNPLVKKASERVPRLNEDGKPAAVSFGGRTDAAEPRANKKATDSKQRAVEARRKQQQDLQKEKMERIEAKIQKARLRRGEESRVRSQVARQTQKRRTAPTPGQESIQNMAEELGLIGAGADFGLNPEREVKVAWDEKRMRGGRPPPAARHPANYGSSQGQQSTASLKNPKLGSAVEGQSTQSRRSLGLHVAGEGEQARSRLSRVGNLESPGKLSQKVGSLAGPEKELAHESHLIHNSEQQPHSHLSRADQDSFTGGPRGHMLTHYPNAPPLAAQQSLYPPGGAKSHQNVPLSWHQETSFDMEFMMPPDITSIDSDINKIGALTPSPFLGDGFDTQPFNLTANQNMGQHRQQFAPQQQRGLHGAPPNQSVYPVLNSGGGNFGGQIPSPGLQQQVQFGFGQQPYYQRAGPDGQQFEQKGYHQQASGAGSGAGQFYQSSYQGGTTAEGTSMGGHGGLNQF